MGKIRVIPVIDLKQGHVVRGIGGRRETYQPVVSSLTQTSHPTEIAQAFQARYGFTELYLADLDAIAGASPAVTVYRDLKQLGFRLLVDAGVRDASQARALGDAGVDHVVVGLETVSGSIAVREILNLLNPDRVVFSLDLFAEKPLGHAAGWRRFTPHGIADEVIELGVRRLIVLDLARVGMRSATGTEALCGQLSARHAAVEFIAGGGVRHKEDLDHLARHGVRAALVASALHDGTLRPEDLAS
jgi:phosphoribosylformimino-5-aminoimidazole carboxamide ribotide isomerase